MIDSALQNEMNVFNSVVVCRLPTLIGAAGVVYSLPLLIKQGQNCLLDLSNLRVVRLYNILSLCDDFDNTDNAESVINLRNVSFLKSTDFVL